MTEPLKFNITGGWMPDLPLDEIYRQGGLKTAKNCYFMNGNYYPLKSNTSYNSSALSGTPLQGISMQDSSGTYYNFVGTSTKLYRVSSTTLTDITRAAGGAYNASLWSFVPFGTWLVAVNKADAPQVLKGLTSANFAALTMTGAAANTKAKFALMDNGHLILANLTEGGAEYPQKILWSAYNDPETYTASVITGADSRTFNDMYGIITGLGTLGKGFTIMSERSMTYGQYTPGTYRFHFNINVLKGIGCFFPASFISIHTRQFFWSQDSIYMITDSMEIDEIGKNIKKEVFPNLETSMTDRISWCHDPANNLIIWVYASAGSATYPNRMILYNYKEDKITHADISCYCIFSGATGGIDADTYAVDGDTITIPGDSSYWLSKNIGPLIVDTDSKVKSMQGSDLEVELETGELSDAPVMLAITKSYMPVEGLTGTSTVAVKHRYSSIDNQTISAFSTVKTDGTADLRITNRRIALDWKAQGFTKIGKTIAADIEAAGGR